MKIVSLQVLAVGHLGRLEAKLESLLDEVLNHFPADGDLLLVAPVGPKL
jgi:hypothetical protein